MQNVTRLNYDEINLITKKILDESDDYAQLHSNTRQKMAALHSDWEGEAADKFFEEMERSLLPAIKRLSQGLISAHDVINNIVKTIQEADQETAAFFRSSDDFGAAGFTGALGAAGLAGGIAGAAGGADFGAGMFNQAAGEGAGGNGPTSEGGLPGEQTAKPGFSSGIEFAKRPEETPAEAAKTAAAETAAAGGAGGGGGGGGAGGSGLQGDLKGLGLGLGGQPASSASVGGSGGGAESLPDHNFGSSGGSAGGSGQASQGGSAGGTSGGEAAPAGNEGVAAGIAGAAGSAALGGAAKVLKDKKDNG